MSKSLFDLNALLKCVYTGCKAKLGNLFQWSITLFAQNSLTIQPQFCLSEVKQSFAKFATCRNFSQVVDDVKLWLIRIALRCFASIVNVPEQSKTTFYTVDYLGQIILRDKLILEASPTKMKIIIIIMPIQ